MVLAYHCFPSYFKSGFIGVDIFYVISGYLMVQILMGSDARDISLKQFYINRFLRLSPALFTVTLSTLITGWFLFISDEYLELSKATISSLFFQSNLYEMYHSGYFETSLTNRPFLHYWSLAVEIQFYILISLIIKWLHRSKYLLTVLISIALTSFVLNLILIDEHNSLVFYLMPFRVWEILLGSIIALIQANKVWPGYLAYFGAFLLSLSFVFIDNSMKFPGFVALVPVIGACFLVLETNPTIVSKLLSLRPLVFIGVLSYSIYLWHWPILDTSKLIYGEISPLYRVMVVLSTLFLAFLTTYLIETPIRKLRRINFLYITYVCILFFAAAIFLNQGFSSREINRLNSDLKINNSFVLDYRRPCSAYIGVSNKEDRCNDDRYVRKETELALVGDSQSNAFTTILEGARSYKPVNYLQLGMGMCPSLLGFGIPECINFAEKTFSYIKSEPSFKTVVIAGQWPLYSDGLTIDGKYLSGSLFWESLDRTVKAYKEIGKDVYLVYTVPGGQPRKCFKRSIFTDGSCQLDARVASENEKNYRVKFDQIILENNLDSLDLKEALCDRLVCTNKSNSTIVYLDNAHISRSGGAYISEVLKDSLLNGILANISVSK